MQQLPKRQRLQHPAAEPPGPLAPPAVAAHAPDEALALAGVPAELERAEHHVDGDGDAQLLRRVDAEGEPGERGAHGGRVGRRQRGGGARVAPPEGLDLRVQEVRAQPRQEAEEDAVEEQDGREREREPQRGRLVKGQLLAGGARAVMVFPSASSPPPPSRDVFTHSLSPATRRATASQPFMPTHVAAKTRSAWRTALAL